jgi:predicted permease
VLFTVFSLVILAVPGYIAIKTKILNAKGADVLSSLVLYIAQPAMLFMSFQKTKYDPNIALNLTFLELS